MAGIHRERPTAHDIHPADGSPAVDLGDDIWMSSGLSNSYLLRTDAGRVVINSGMGFEGGLHRRAYETIATSRAKAPANTAIHSLIFTQGHFDHVGGADHLRDADTALVAQENFAVWRADNERLEKFRSRNAAFAWIDAIVAAMEHARDVGATEMAQARPEPTVTFRDRLELAVGGRELVLIATPGGETFDSCVVWLPESRTLFSGNLFGPLFGHVPNLVTIRGDRYRDALTYITSLDAVLDLAPARLITGHFDPIDSADRIATEIGAMREAMRWVHDRTVDGMNSGVDVHTLMRTITVPSALDVGEDYGKTSWNVRAIWENYAGWFHHRSTTELYGVPFATIAPDLVAAAGANALVALARTKLAAGEAIAALHFVELVLSTDPGHSEARAVAAAATSDLLAQTDNFWEAAWLRCSLSKLERRQ